MTTTLSPRIERSFLLLWAAVVGAYFLWTRFDTSSYIYYFGDGTYIVQMIHLMLSSGNWDPNWSRLANDINPPAWLLPYMDLPKAGEIIYHMSGYVTLATGVSKIIYSLGFSNIPIQTILHGLNSMMQICVLWLLFDLGKKLHSPAAGLFAASLFTLFPLAVLESRYERPETWLCLLAIATLHGSFSFHAKPVRQSLIIGLLIGLAIATKMTALFLGMIPAIMLLHYGTNTSNGSLMQRSQRVLFYGVLILAGIVIGIAINVPQMLSHIRRSIDLTIEIMSFYQTPAYPYALEHYHYADQLLVSLRYFWLTLGALWCLCVLSGLVKILRGYQTQPIAEKGFYLSLLIPPVFFVFYFAKQVNFIERNYSPFQGFFCLIASLGFFYLFDASKHLLKNSRLHLAVWMVIAAALLYTPVKISYISVTHYFHHPDKPGRNHFQDELKKDFPGFWIKNIPVVYKDGHPIPERPPKAPRIYQLDDLNDYWSRDALLALESQGFRKVAIYCSEFFYLPTNSITIYHASAKNHYFVREDEWPANVPQDYFKTNCPH